MGLLPTEMKPLKQVEDENSRLKQIVAGDVAPNLFRVSESPYYLWRFRRAGKRGLAWCLADLAALGAVAG